MMSADFEPRRDRAPLPQRPNYLRVVFERDGNGGIVRGEDGRRSIAAVEHVASGEVIHTKRFDSPPTAEQSTAVEGESQKAVMEDIPAVETVLLEN